ncbi:hypothetical protein BJV74DRAFT_820594 [Russula compacta]|nr:hypothetical protein BJV74DRAFT_820594 [Russula compacta]
MMNSGTARSGVAVEAEAERKEGGVVTIITKARKTGVCVCVCKRRKERKAGDSFVMICAGLSLSSRRPYPVNRKRSIV